MEKLKSFLHNDQIFYGLVVILVGIGSFMLGQQSVSQNVALSNDINRVNIITKPVNTIEQSSNVISSQVEQGSDKYSLVASKSGTKYHLITCPGAKQIKPDNLIYFETKNQAEAAGYTKAANCPGL